MFLKTCVRWRPQICFRNEGAVSGVLYKNNFVSDLLESQHLFEILQTSLTFNNSVMVELDVSKNSCDGERLFFSKMKEGYKVCSRNTDILLNN